MLALISAQASAERPPLPQAGGRLRVALVVSLLLHGAAMAWILGNDEPVRVGAEQPVQVLILAAAPAPVVPDATMEPLPIDKPHDPPVAVLDEDARSAQPPLHARAQPKPRPRPEVAKRLSERTDTPPARDPREAESAATAPVETVAPAVTAPRFEADYLDNPPPAYPRLSRRLREEGEVELRVRVDAAGRAVAVELARSSGSARLDEAALQAVQHWRFEPARQGEQAVEAWVRVPILFKLEA